MSRTLVDNSIDKANWDVVVIGAGAAGLMTCLELPSSLNVLLLNRNTSRRSSSRWAQGGIAAVTRPEDSLDSHAEDTIKAGAGLCDLDAVKMLVKEAPNCVEHLEKLGMQFDRELDQLSTTLEAAHTHRRVLHVKDRTGRELVEVLEDQVEQRKNCFHSRGVRAIQLWIEGGQCCGVQVLDGPKLYWIGSRAVVLATGGGGHLFANTTNPTQACGEGLALAWKAGAIIQDVEFVQFHPTALKLENAPCFLISEALRGEGAKLIDQYGCSPVSSLKGGDLAPRDQVSRALFDVMQNQSVSSLSLDLKGIPSECIERRFPSIVGRCREFGIDPLRDLIPIAPAAHYWMGGVATDLEAATNVPGLYAVGEVACTGLHGANRLASNSLMECLVFARRMSAIDLSNKLLKSSIKSSKKLINCDLPIDGSEDYQSMSISIEKLRNLCWNVAGVNRSPKNIANAICSIKYDFKVINNQSLINLAKTQSKELVHYFTESSRRDLNLLLDLNNRQLTSLLMLKACLFRKESRGGHFRSDSPLSMPFWQCHSSQQLGRDISTKPVNLL